MKLASNIFTFSLEKEEEYRPEIFFFEIRIISYVLFYALLEKFSKSSSPYSLDTNRQFWTNLKIKHLYIKHQDYQLISYQFSHKGTADTNKHNRLILIEG